VKGKRTFRRLIRLHFLQSDKAIKEFRLSSQNIHQPERHLSQRWLILLLQQRKQLVTNAVPEDVQALIRSVLAKFQLPGTRIFQKLLFGAIEQWPNQPQFWICRRLS